MVKTAEYQCAYCGKKFFREKRNVSTTLKNGGKLHCSRSCSRKARSKKQEMNCKNCNKLIYKSPHEITPNNFCSHSCSATYNNKHKSGGCRRSKLEKWIENQLQTLYPNLVILFNNKSTINSELDIYIQSLGLAFELNGIFHYEPIFGKDKLQKTMNNDNNKFQKCIANNISLCIIDVSKQKHFTEKSSIIYLEIIKNIINSKLAMTKELESS